MIFFFTLCILLLVNYSNLYLQNSPHDQYYVKISHKMNKSELAIISNVAEVYITKHLYFNHSKIMLTVRHIQNSFFNFY